MDIFNKSEMYDFFITNANYSSKSKKSWLIKHHNDLYLLIENNCQDEISFIEKIWLYVNDLNDIPKCIVCGNNCKFQGKLKLGYSTYCSPNCRNSSEVIKQKRKNTIFERFGVEHALQSDILKNKMNNSIFERFGVDSISKNCEINKKKVNTFNLHYGVDNIFSLPETQDNIRNIQNIKFIKRISNKLNIDVNNLIIQDNNIIFKNYCEKHDEFIISKQNYYNRIKGSTTLCTCCYPIGDSPSIKELEVKKFINTELNIKTEKLKIDGKEIDIYSHEHKLGIEFDGLYWHSNIHKDKNYHSNKTDDCEKREIQLLHVFEDEWIYKKEMVKSIIRSKLNMFENQIFANECKISEIDNKTCKLFLNNNHILGNLKSSIRFGLFYDDALVSVMTFIKLGKGNKYEMLRFCDKLNTHIINGSNILLKYFENQYNPMSIITFSDRRYFNYELYSELGFNYIKKIAPDYYYFKMGELIRKHHSFYLKSEYEIIKKEKYLTIYDCGSIKFIKNY